MADFDPLDDPLSGAWLTDGHDEHLSQARAVAGPVLDLINRGLRLLAWLISAEREVAAHSAFPNDLGSLACFTQAFRQVRGAVTLCMFGYYNEARMLERGIYEASGLGRMIAHDASQSQRWIGGTWIPDSQSGST